MNKENIRKQYNKSKRYFVKYKGDTRYEKVWEQMQLLGIEDITTKRQSSNGTVVWRLPIRVYTAPSITKFIEVGSFKSGMVRNNNSAYSNYQLNKCKSRDKYFKDYKTTWNNDNTDYTQEWTGKYNKYTCKERILIPLEIDRLEYLISYCLKNYYIKRANKVANGDFVPKWRYEDAKSGRDLEGLIKARDYFKSRAYEAEEELKNRPALDNLSVTVNGERYKII
jgi:hypothetical protein